MIAFDPTEDQVMIQSTVREFARGELRRLDRESDDAEQVSEDLLQALWTLGLVSSAIPEEYGGGGLVRSPVTSALVLEELGYGCVGLAVAAMAPALFVNALIDLGTDSQRKRYLPAFTGERERCASLALSEPRPACDLARLRTRAARQDGEYVLSGRKAMVPMADRAEHFLVVASTEAEGGLDSLGAFIVPRDAPGLKLGPREPTMGLRAVSMGSLELEGVRVPAEDRLGGEAGVDLRRLVDLGRVAGAALATGLSRGVLEYCIPYAKERVAFGEPIARKQAIAFMLAEMRIEVNAMRLLTWKAASQLERGQSATRAAQLAQVYSARETVKIADNGVQIFGGHGYIRDFPLEMWLRNARTLTVLEGACAV